MSTNALLTNVLIEVLDTSTSPNAYDAVEEVTSLSGLGETTPQVRATHFQSTSEEYIGGLADGEEFNLECNRIHTGGSAQAKLVSYKGLTKSFRVTETDTSVSPNTTVIYTFDALVQGWTNNPSLGDIQKISFSGKISGGITVA